jgi:hypothetical protein
MSHDSELFVTSVIAIATTLFLGSIAIFKDWYASIFAAPILTVTLRDPEAESVPILLDGAPLAGLHYHLTITNKRKWAPAANVRVIVEQEWFVDAGGTAISSQIAGPVLLDWRLPSTRPLSVIVRDEDICDLAYIAQGHSLFVAVPLKQRPTNFHGVIGPGECEILQVRVVADNGESEAIWVRLQWDGFWSPVRSVMKDHLVVQTCANPRITFGRVAPPPNRIKQAQKSLDLS